jgi:hypothetical protein
MSTLAGPANGSSERRDFRRGDRGDVGRRQEQMRRRGSCGAAAVDGYVQTCRRRPSGGYRAACVCFGGRGSKDRGSGSVEGSGQTKCKVGGVLVRSKTRIAKRNIPELRALTFVSTGWLLAAGSRWSRLEGASKQWK